MKIFLGPPSSVVDLTAEQQDNCSLSAVQWKPPYVLPGLNILYNVTIINGETITTDSTNYTSHNCIDGRYCVNVKAFNGAIVGEPTLMYSRDALHQNCRPSLDYIILF